MSLHDMTRNSDRLRQIPIEISVRVCRRNLTLSEFLQWSPGKVIEFDQPATSPLLLQIDHKIVGRGEPVKIGSQMGLRIQNLGDDVVGARHS
ncbi:FliM/FliN family flagellar motor switch protein [Schlesneria paludicola]|uniref:FliM/FliN family flagellar motor switch protein n=1 Tax=Schlesneria paludicola TaxID=360056 RepID=UPI0004926A6F|nr:FliM/FliN family flagellar motor C-terminal domain-containing protein [Schlesneria paludicola]